MPVIDRTAIILDIFADHAALGRGQAPGRAGAARVQPRPHARAVDPPRAPRRRGIGTRGPGESQIETDRRLARDRIAALQAPARARRRPARAGDARSERERAGTADGRAGRLHERRQVDAAERAHRRRGRRARPPLPHARPDHPLVRDRRAASTCSPTRSASSASCRTSSSRPSRPRSRRRSDADLIVHVADASVPRRSCTRCSPRSTTVLAEIGAGERPRLLALNKVDLLDDERRRELSFRYPRRRAGLGGDGRGARRRCARRSRRASWPRCSRWSCSCPTRRAARLSELHDAGRRAGARGHRRRACASGRACPRAWRRASSASWRRQRRGADAGDAALPRASTRGGAAPARAHDGDAGFDLYAAEAATLGPGERASVGTGIAVAIPEGHAGLVLPRSGLAARARHRAGQRARPDRLRLPRRAARAAAEHRRDAEPSRSGVGDRIAQLVMVRVARPSRSRSRRSTSRRAAWADSARRALIRRLDIGDLQACLELAVTAVGRRGDSGGCCSRSGPSRLRGPGRGCWHARVYALRAERRGDL